MLELLIIQPTPFCNLDCDYCYLPGRQSKARISREVLEQVFNWAFACSATGHEFTVVWHAGEPMVLPVAFYRDALEIITRRNCDGVRVSHSFQTNGTLLTPEWCKFIRKEELRIGVSIDGPDFLHDWHRKTRSRRGTHAQTMRGIRLLQEYEIPFHVITVLTRETLDFADEMFEFYLETGIRQIAFNVEEIEGPHTNSSLANDGAEERYREFLSRFFNLAKMSGERFFVREFDSAIAAVQGGEIEERAGQQISPMGIISVDCQGNFSTFSPEMLGLSHKRFSNFIFGNVMRDSFDSMLDNPKFQTVAREIDAGVQRCRETCEYFPYCGGGAPVNKLFENDSFDSTETLFCRFSKKVVLDVVLEKLSAAASG